MRAKLKVILPVVNVAIAATLLGIGYGRRVEGWFDIPVELAYSINAPANLLRDLTWFEWNKHIYPHCSAANSEACIKAERGIETVVFLLGIAFVWYVVAVEIEAGRRGTRAMARFGTPARAFVDVVLFSVGAVFAFLFVANWRTLPNVPGSWFIFFYLAWALALVISYGNDLVRIVRRS